MWYIYVLKTIKNEIYVGSTNDLKRRLKEHELGQNRSTKAMRPLSLESYFAVKTEKQARTLEQYFKKGSGKAFLKKRILSDEASA